MVSDQIGLMVVYEMRRVSKRKKPRMRPQKERLLQHKTDSNKTAMIVYS